MGDRGGIIEDELNVEKLRKFNYAIRKYIDVSTSLLIG